MVAYEGSGYAASMKRCIDFTFNQVSMSMQLTFVNGVASGTLQLPVGIYSCSTADDDLHSLVSRADIVISGTQYTVMFLGNEALVNGDANDDNLVNVVDWAIVVTRIGTPASVDTNCDTVPFHVDFDGDGVVTEADGQFVLGNILEYGDNGCSAPQIGVSSQVIASASSRIRVQDLSAIIGGADAQRADITGDGTVDMQDVQRWRDRRGVAANAPQRKR
jgi:exo-beta-1,3-glucanase (GH17 family)